MEVFGLVQIFRIAVLLKALRNKNMPPIFGLTQYREIARLQKLIKKAKTDFDRKRFQSQIDVLKAEIKKAEEAEEYFGKR
jgi:hypothetical protein